MADTVLVSLPVSREAARVLEDAGKRQKMGQLVSDVLRPKRREDDPLAALIAEVKADARAEEPTDAEIDADLAAYNAERRI